MVCHRRGTALPASVRATARARTRARQPERGVRAQSVLDWLPIIEDGFAADGLDLATARELTTLTLAVVRGLLQDANAVGDHQRVSAAFHRYASLLQSARAPN